MQVRFLVVSRALCSVLLVLAAHEARGDFAFTKVADNTTAAPSGTFSSFLTDPAIGGGVVAFQGVYGSGGTSKGIFNGSGGALTSIVKTGDAAPAGTYTDFGGRGPEISGGTTVFHGKYVSGQSTLEGIFTGSGGAPTAIAISGGAAPSGTFTSFDDPAISGGTVAFNGTYSGAEGVFTSSGGVRTTLTTSIADLPVRAYSNLSSPAVSGSNVAFYGVFSGTGGAGSGIFMDSVGPTITIAKNGDPAPTGTFTSFFNQPTISGTTVAFVAGYTGGGEGVFTGSGGAVTTIAKIGDTLTPTTHLASFMSTVALNGATAAFVGVGDNGGNPGIYTGSGGALTTVIKGGDSLFGSTVSQLSLGPFSLDADGSGRLAFYYALANGNRGVAIAAPSVAIPGDYNHNGSVGPEDYAVWRSNFGSTTNLDADGNGNHVVDAADYVLWRSQSLSAHGTANGDPSLATGSPVPEPTAGVLLACAALGLLWGFGRSARNAIHQ